MNKKLKYIFILIAIILLAAFFRIYKLDTIPPGLYPDEALNGNEAISSPGKIFYPENNGREGLYFSLLSMSFLAFGKSVFSLRLVSAIIGILTVPGLFLLTREIFLKMFKDRGKAERIALLASFFIAVSFWHINFSRIGFRGILVPFVLVYSFYFFFKAIFKDKIWNFIPAGIFFGLGFYTYIGFRLAVLLLFWSLFCWWLFCKSKNIKKSFWKPAFYFVASIFIVSLPIGIYFLKNPSHFVSRASNVSVFSSNNFLLALGESFVKHLGMFNIFGDFNWRHNIAGSPVLFWPVGILFLIGFVICSKYFISAFKKKDYLAIWLSSFILVWFFVMLLPGILTYEGVPHALRSVGSIPAVFILAALGFEFVFQKAKSLVKVERNSLSYLVLSLTLILIVSSFIFAQYFRYFVTWGMNPELNNAFSTGYVRIGDFLNSQPEEVKKYVLVNQLGVPVPYPSGISVSAQTIMFTERTKFEKLRAEYLEPKEIDKIESSPDRDTVIALMNYDENLFFELWKRFPEGQIEAEKGVWVYKIKAKI